MRQAEDAGNEEAKSMWRPHLSNASKNLAKANSAFQELESKRLALIVEAAKCEAEAKFAQAKADAAVKICGPQCPPFTSFIELEEYYATLIETQGPADVLVPPVAVEYSSQYMSAEPYVVAPENGSEPPLIIPFQHELYDFKAFEKGPELYKFNEPQTPQLKSASPAKMPTLIGNWTPAQYSSMAPSYGSFGPVVYPSTSFQTPVFQVPSVTTTTTEVRTAAKDATLYSTQDGDTSEGFQKGNSISIPLPSSAAPVLPADAVSASQDASKAEALKADAVQPC